MDMIGLEGRTNFFERRVSEYKLAQVQLHPDSVQQRTQHSSNIQCDL